VEEDTSGGLGPSRTVTPRSERVMYTTFNPKLISFPSLYVYATYISIAKRITSAN
jgi:hypothetical protein